MQCVWVYRRNTTILYFSSTFSESSSSSENDSLRFYRVFLERLLTRILQPSIPFGSPFSLSHSHCNFYSICVSSSSNIFFYGFIFPLRVHVTLLWHHVLSSEKARAHLLSLQFTQSHLQWAFSIQRLYF